MPASLIITITGPDQASLDAMVAAFAASKGWRLESGYEAVEFARVHLGAYFADGAKQTAMNELSKQQAAEAAAVQAAITAQASAFTLTVEKDAPTP